MPLEVAASYARGGASGEDTTRTELPSRPWKERPPPSRTAASRRGTTATWSKRSAFRVVDKASIPSVSELTVMYKVYSSILYIEYVLNLLPFIRYLLYTPPCYSVRSPQRARVGMGCGTCPHSAVFFARVSCGGHDMPTATRQTMGTASLVGASATHRHARRGSAARPARSRAAGASGCAPPTGARPPGGGADKSTGRGSRVGDAWAAGRGASPDYRCTQSPLSRWWGGGRGGEGEVCVDGRPPR